MRLCACFAAVLAASVIGGCGDDDRGGTTDSGTPDTDSGSVDVDSGPTPDTGTPVDTGTPTGRGSMCPAGACNLVTNGCAGGQACYFLAPSAGAPGEPMCATSGTGGDGDPCSTYMDCQEGFDCNVGEGRCVAYCCMGQHSDCPTGQLCAISLVDDMGMDTGVGFCVAGTDCDPVTNEGCTGTEGCYPISTDGAMDCIEPIADGMEGDPCTAANGCVPGHGCFTPSGGSPTCLKFCRTDDMATCASGQTCSSLGYPGEQANLGVCTPAMMMGGGGT